ncbi:hypothetical protein DICVIV_11857, partial [Dictyocaulus viviparus]
MHIEHEPFLFYIAVDHAVKTHTYLIGEIDSARFIWKPILNNIAKRCTLKRIIKKLGQKYFILLCKWCLNQSAAKRSRYIELEEENEDLLDEVDLFHANDRKLSVNAFKTRTIIKDSMRTHERSCLPNVTVETICNYTNIKSIFHMLEFAIKQQEEVLNVEGDSSINSEISDSDFDSDSAGK